MQTNTFVPKYHDNFNGGINYAFGARQIADNESPSAIDCDFKGRSGIGNRQGYSQIGAVADSRTKIYGMNEFHTAAVDQLLKFASNGSNIELYTSTGGAFSEVSGTTFTNALNMDSVQAGGKLYTFNGTDAMKNWDGSSWGTTTNGKALLYGEYYNQALWGVDPSAKDTLWVSGQLLYSHGSLSESKLGDFTYDASTNKNAQSLIFRSGSGAEIKGLKSFKGSLYVFLYPFGIYQISPASNSSGEIANVYAVSLVTNAVGCVSHRSIVQVGEDLMFAADDGIYSLGDVANYVGVVRSTNKSAKIQRIYDSLNGTTKQLLCAGYFNFKYHLFYSQFGTSNDSCVPYDVRYKAWQDWRNIAANDSTTFTDSTKTQRFYFGEPTTGKVQQMYSGSTNDGSIISSSFDTKSFDEGIPDIVKFYFDTTFIFGQLNGSVTVSKIFDDTIISKSKSISQVKPQGGFGRDAFGRKAFGAATNTIVSITNVIGTPQRMSAKGQKFAVQYRVQSSGDWRLDVISEYMQIMSHFKFFSQNRIT